MKRVLFVCLGNICRSPLAEAIFNHKGRGLDMEADSAGTAAYHIGEQPDHRTIKVAMEYQVPIDHQARKFKTEDFENFDYIIAMDKHNFDDIQATAGRSHKNLHLLREFDPDNAGQLDVPDPYYGGYEGFIHIFDIISRSVDRLIDHIGSNN